jgi:pimeloyl-ACP methyl ester carboxylesterase
MKYLGISEFAVVGLSVGGMWGAHLALMHPQAVSALVLMDTFLGSEPQATRQKYFGLLDAIEREQRFTNLLIDQVAPLFFSPHTLAHQQDLVAGFKKALSAVKKESIPGIVTLGRAIFSRNCILNQLPLITQPALVLVGKDDIPRPPKEAEEMAHRLPNAKMHIIDRAGHISNLEQPEAVSSLLSNFLAFQNQAGRSE